MPIEAVDLAMPVTTEKDPVVFVNVIEQLAVFKEPETLARYVTDEPDVVTPVTATTLDVCVTMMDVAV